MQTPGQDLVHSIFLCGETFAQIYINLCGDAMLVPIWKGTNMAAGNLQKHLSLSFSTKA